VPVHPTTIATANANDMDATALLTLIEDTCADHAAQPGTISGIAVALDALGVDTMRRATTWANSVNEPVFIVYPPAGAAIVEFQNAVLGAAAAGALPDSVAIRAIITSIAMGIASAGVGGNKPTAEAKPDGKPKDDEDEEATALSAYKDLHKLQGRYTELSSQCVFVGGARKSVKKHGHIAKLPSLSKLPRYGHAGQKRKIASFGEGTTLEVDDVKAKPLDTIQSCHRATRDLVRGIVASMTFPIATTAFGGRESGWITPPGSTTQVRVMLDAETGERLERALCGSVLTQPGPYGRMADAVLTKFTDLCACARLPRTHASSCAHGTAARG
jgi:hypothetical protein